MKTIFLFFLFPSFIECLNLKHNEMCYIIDEKENECYGKHNFNCANFVCTKNRYNCHLLSLFSESKGVQHQKKYISFMRKVKDCPRYKPHKYKWSPNNVCLITKNCKLKSYLHRLIQIKPYECKCSEKYNFRCNINYCGLDKRACDGLNKNMTGGIQNCN
jgi:hypothetical protein